MTLIQKEKKCDTHREEERDFGPNPVDSRRREMNIEITHKGSREARAYKSNISNLHHKLL